MFVCWHLCVCVCQCACANRRWHLRKQCRGLQPPSWRFASQSLVEDQGDGGLRKCSSTFGPKRRTVLGQMFLCWPQTFHTRIHVVYTHQLWVTDMDPICLKAPIFRRCACEDCLWRIIKCSFSYFQLNVENKSFSAGFNVGTGVIISPFGKPSQ